MAYNIFCWKDIKVKINSLAWAEATVEAIKNGFEGFLNVWDKEPPLEESDWSHHYFCKKCAVRLMMDFHKPHEHLCTSCGEIYTGSPYDGTWRKFVHGSIVVNLERAAILANLYPQNKQYGVYIKKTIMFYAENYHLYEIHGKNAGKGKVFPQCLTEAIFVIDIERTLRMVRELELFSSEDRLIIGEKFFRPAVELLKPQISEIHNIHAWMDGAIAAAANFLQDEELMKFAIDGEYGWLNQVEKGVTEDGLWYEISPTTYHFYTVSALLSLAWIALENGRNLFLTIKFKKMLISPVLLAYKNEELPAYNDSWYGQTLKGVSPIYEQCSHQYPDLTSILAGLYLQGESKHCAHLSCIPNQYHTPVTGFIRNSVGALLFGASSLPDAGNTVKGSRVFMDTGISILENERLRAGMKFTKHGGGHDHYDKLGIDIYAFDEQISADFGTSGYGLELTQKWNRTSVAHNLVVINGEKQKASNAKLIHWDDKSVTAETTQAYPNKLLRRTLELEENGFTDCFEVLSDEESVMDWIFHCKGNLDAFLPDGSRLPFEELVPFMETNGYDQIVDLHEVTVDCNWTAMWCMPTGTLKLDFEGSDGTQVIMGKCYGINGLERLGIVIVRRKGRGTVFKSRFTLVKYSAK